MSIIDPPTDSTQLLQGDILKGVALYATERSWEDGGGKPAKLNHNFCLVLSRPCVAIHKNHIIVAGIEKYQEPVPRDVTFEEAIDFLTTIRDGSSSPDCFYLGQLPVSNGRFCARLDTLFSIQVPSSESERASFLKKARVGSLNIEFARDLHLRVFRAFASLGFSDQGWLSDADLNWVVEIGKSDLLAEEAKFQKEKVTKAGQLAKGEQFSHKAFNKSEQRVAKLKTELQPYVDERECRGTNGEEIKGVRTL